MMTCICRTTLFFAAAGLVLATSGLGAAEPAPPATAPAASGFSFVDKKGEYLDVFLDGRLTARYMYAFDDSSPARLQQTYKPYLHVIDTDGKTFLTKGPGGTFTHHRGIFIGWQKIGFNGKTYNIWEMAGGTQVHQKFLAQTAGADQASFTALVAWKLKDGTTIIEEERTHTFYRRPAPTIAFIDFVSRVKAVAGDLTLSGDPEHGGIQYRASGDVALKETKYCLPEAGVDSHLDKKADWVRPFYEDNGKQIAVAKVAAQDLPWAAISYVVVGKTYYVEEMNHPDNPKGTVWSAYRDYGRFGAFPKAELKKDATLTVRYRFWVTGGDAPTRADFQKQAEAYAASKPGDGK